MLPSRNPNCFYIYIYTHWLDVTRQSMTFIKLCLIVPCVVTSVTVYGAWSYIVSDVTSIPHTIVYIYLWGMVKPKRGAGLIKVRFGRSASVSEKGEMRQLVLASLLSTSLEKGPLDSQWQGPFPPVQQLTAPAKMSWNPWQGWPWSLLSLSDCPEPATHFTSMRSRSAERMILPKKVLMPVVHTVDFSPGFRSSEPLSWVLEKL